MPDETEAGELPVITLSPEYGYDLPLEGPFQQFDISASLLDALGDWQQYFEDNFDPHAGGWRTSESERRWTDEAVELEFGLRRAVWGRATVVVHLWPVDGTQRPDDSV
jgi:hypothetical protein